MKITDWFSEEKNKILIDNFIKLNIGYEKKENANNSNILEGKSFVVTGSFDEYSRNDIESIIKTHGGKVSSKVSSKTNNLILGLYSLIASNILKAPIAVTSPVCSGVFQLSPTND